jgi:hypothetical protein
MRHLSILDRLALLPYRRPQQHCFAGCVALLSCAAADAKPRTRRGDAHRPLPCHIGSARTPPCRLRSKRRAAAGLTWPAVAASLRSQRQSRQSRRRRPDRSARRPPGCPRPWRRATVCFCITPQPPSKGGFHVAALLAVRRVLGLQPYGLPHPARAATSTPPRQWPPSSNAPDLGQHPRGA